MGETAQVSGLLHLMNRWGDRSTTQAYPLPFERLYSFGEQQTSSNVQQPGRRHPPYLTSHCWSHRSMPRWRSLDSLILTTAGSWGSTGHHARWCRWCWVATGRCWGQSRSCASSSRHGCRWSRNPIHRTNLVLWGGHTAGPSRCLGSMVVH